MRVIKVDDSRKLHICADISTGLLILLLTVEPLTEVLLEPHLLQEEIKTAVAYKKAQSKWKPGAHPFHGNLFTVSGNHSGTAKKKKRRFMESIYAPLFNCILLYQYCSRTVCIISKQVTWVHHGCGQGSTLTFLFPEALVSLT